MSKQLIGVAATVWLTAGCATLNSQGDGTTSQTRVLPEWEATFKSSHPAWRGSDAAYSVPLSSNKTLWLFGDTWIASGENEGRNGARLVRNTIGIQSNMGHRPAPIAYHWATEKSIGGEPSAVAFLRTDSDSDWYWPLDGIRVGDRLVLFVSRLIEGGGMGFTGVGNEILVVNNPDAAPDDWMWKPHPILYYQNTEHGDRVFGLSVEAANGSIYVYGIHTDWRRGMGGRGVIVARTTPDEMSVGDVSNWRFFDGSGWTEDVDSAKELFLEAAAEMTVHFDSALNRFVAVYTRFGLSDEIMARFAERPEGPWSEAVVVYRCPEVKENSNYFCYAAKVHPEFEIGNGETLVTYAVNSQEFADHFNDMDLYWPRCIGARLAEFMDEAERR